MNYAESIAAERSFWSIMRQIGLLRNRIKDPDIVWFLMAKAVLRALRLPGG